MDTAEVDVTEIVELDATKVSAVGAPANGTPWLLLKASADQETCSTCEGKGTIMEGNRKCPDCKGTGSVAKSSSSEADEEQEELTDEAAKGMWCGNVDCEFCGAAKAMLNAADRKALPASSFAFVDKNGDKHLPIHDEGHVNAAKGRVSQTDFSEAKGDPADAKSKAEAKIAAAAKKFGIGESKKGAVQDALNGTDTPMEAGHLDTGQSGISGSVTDGTRTDMPADSSQALAGRTTSSIPSEQRVIDNPPAPASTDAAGILNPEAVGKAIAVASLAEAIDKIGEQRQAIKDGKYLETSMPPADVAPGSPQWESYDAATLAQVASTLAGCCRALDEIAQRERTEAATADPDDINNAWDLEEAESALEYALGIAARLSFHEAAEGEATKSAESVAKVGRMLSSKNKSALMAARDHLSSVIDGAKNLEAGDADHDSEENDIVTTVTKDELGEIVGRAAGEAAVEAVKSVLKAERKAAKKAAEEAAKNANNGGDVSTADVHATSSADADDVNAVSDGGHVDPQYVNASKGAGDEAEAGALSKQVADQLEGLTKGLADVQELVGKIAKRPRSGGPSLDGQARGLSPATEGRLSTDVTKSGIDGEIETLEKQLEATADPGQREGIAMQLVHRRLMKGHEEGTI